MLSRLLCEKAVKVNGKRVDGIVELFPGDEVVYYTSVRQEAMPSHTCVYEDVNIFVADKFQGVNSEALETELKERGDFRLVHRIDRNTAGLLFFAKCDEAEKELLDAFRERRIEKKYLALCKNAFKEKSRKMRAYLKKDAENSNVVVTDSPAKGASEIETDYEVLEERGDVALVSVTIHTGKTHQIRAHMAHIGCPVLGDEKYGDKDLNAEYGARRQRLVSKSLTMHISGGLLSYLDGKAFVSSQLPDGLNR